MSFLEVVNVVGDSVGFGNDTQDYTKLNYSDGQLIWVRIPPWEMTVKIVVWLPLVIVGLLGNISIIVVMCCVKSIRTCTNMFIFNMAIADLTTVLLSSWTILVHDFHQNYLLGPFICRSEGFVQVTCFLASVFSLVTISCDRLLAVTFPLAPRLNKKKSIYIIVFIWYASMACGLPTIFYRSWHRREWNDYTETWCTEDKRLKYYWFTMLVLLCYLPLTIITIAYSIIIYQLNKYEHRLFLGEQPTKQKYRKKVLEMLFIYVLNFLWCWVLFQVVVLYRYFKPESKELPKWHKQVFFAAHLLTYMNSAINPIVYCNNNESFRKAAKLTFPCLFHTNRIKPNPQVVRVIEMQPGNNNNKEQDG